MDEEALAPRLTERAKHALASTQRWASFAGFALFSLALLVGLRSGAGLFDLIGKFRAGGMQRAVLVGGLVGLGFTLLWGIGANAALGWSALRYGSALERIKLMEQPDQADVVRALGSQYRYWRLQGVLTVVVVALLVLTFVFAIVAVAIGHR